MFNNIPDVVKCGNDVLFLDLVIGGLYIYRESSGATSMNREGLNDSGWDFGGLNCGFKTLAQLKIDGQVFNILSKMLQRSRLHQFFRCLVNFRMLSRVIQGLLSSFITIMMSERFIEALL